MKRLLTIALMAVLTLAAGAQEVGVWSSGMNEADELTGSVAGPWYRYDVNGVGSFILWDFDGWSFKVLTEKGAFDVWRNEGTYATVYYVSVKIGLYDNENNLIEKFDDTIEADYNSMKSAWINKNWPYTPGKRKKLKKMLRALKDGSGHVRIVIPRKSMPDFDMKIMPYVPDEEAGEEVSADASPEKE